MSLTSRYSSAHESTPKRTLFSSLKCTNVGKCTLPRPPSPSPSWSERCSKRGLPCGRPPSQLAQSHTGFSSPLTCAEVLGTMSVPSRSTSFFLCVRHCTRCRANPASFLCPGEQQPGRLLQRPWMVHPSPRLLSSARFSLPAQETSPLGRDPVEHWWLDLYPACGFWILERSQCRIDVF